MSVKLLSYTPDPECVAGSCGEGSFSCGKINEVRAKYDGLDDEGAVDQQLDVTE